MSSFDFIVDGIRYSFSSTTTFETCAYAFKLAYIDAVPRQNNFFAEYGTVVHEVFEAFFKKEVDIFELPAFYKYTFSNVVKTPPPPFPPGMSQNYFNDGLNFFNNFTFPLEDFDVVGVEDFVEFDIEEGVNFVVKPDLILRERSNEKFIMYDYKTSKPYRTDKRTKTVTADKKKLEGYERQLRLYGYGMRTFKNIPIEEFVILYPRLMREDRFPWDADKEAEVLEWVRGLIHRIKNEEEFKYDNSQNYFCNQICGVRQFCEFH